MTKDETQLNRDRKVLVRALCEVTKPTRPSLPAMACIALLAIIAAFWLVVGLIKLDEAHRRHFDQIEAKAYGDGFGAGYKEGVKDGAHITFVKPATKEKP